MIKTTRHPFPLRFVFILLYFLIPSYIRLDDADLFFILAEQLILEIQLLASWLENPKRIFLFVFVIVTTVTPHHVSV